MRAGPLVFLAALAGVAPHAASSQNLASPSEIERKVDGGPAAGDAVLRRNLVEVLAGTEKGQATLTIGKAQKYGPSAWSVKFSAPVDKEDEQARLASLDGLSDAIRAQAQLAWFFGRPAEFEDPSRFTAARNEVCVEAAKIRGLSEPESYVDDNCYDADDAGTSFFSLSDTDLGRLALDRAGAADRERRLRQLENRYDCIHWAGDDGDTCNKSFFIVAAGGTFGSEEFKFFDAATQAAEEVDESVWAVSASVSMLRIPSSWLYRLAYRRERGFKAAGSKLFCDPASPGQPLTCQQLAGGPPSQVDSDILTLEARRARGVVGLAPKLSFDLESDVLGIEVPIYLMRDESGLFNGGLSLGWRDDDRDLIVAAFLGAPLKFLSD